MVYDSFVYRKGYARVKKLKNALIDYHYLTDQAIGINIFKAMKDLENY